jgi:hypothetical protein
MIIRIAVLVFFLAMTGVGIGPARAADNDLTLSGLLQNEFDDLSLQLGMVISYAPMAPAEPLGVIGLDVGIEMQSVNIDENESFWSKAVSDQDAPSLLLFPKLHVQKGLPFGLDIGAVYSQVPSSNISMAGGEIKWALLKGTIVTPALAIRGSYTTLLGVDDLDLSTYGLDLSVSKGFGFITPYAGVGEVWIKSQENIDTLDLNEFSDNQTKGFIGAKVKLLLLSLVGEADFGEVTSYGLRINVSL